MSESGSRAASRARSRRACDDDEPGDPESAARLSAGAVALLNAIAAAAPAPSDPWRSYPPVLRAEHVAEILGITTGSAREAARRGTVPMTRRLGRYMVDQTVFRRWLAGFDVWREGLVASGPEGRSA